MEQKDIEVCKVTVIHEDAVNLVQNNLHDDDFIEAISDFYKVLGEPTRIRIINSLEISEMCVCDLAVVLNMNQSAISHQLKILKQANIVKFRKDGKCVYYSLKDDHIRLIFDQGMIHIKEK
jgi:ArsR family transcriptional regulator